MNIYDLENLVLSTKDCIYIEADVEVNSKKFDGLQITHIVLDKINNSVKVVIECYHEQAVLFKAKKENIIVTNVNVVKLVKVHIE